MYIGVLVKVSQKNFHQLKCIFEQVLLNAANSTKVYFILGSNSKRTKSVFKMDKQQSRTGKIQKNGFLFQNRTSSSLVVFAFLCV